MSASSPSLRDLAAFDAVVRVGSLGAAARDLGLSQPAVTETLARLEARAGLRLIDRGARGSFPTPAGARLAVRVARFFDRLDAAVASAGACPAVARKLTGPAIRAHLAVARAGSFPAAARRLRVTPPALNRAARGLERLLGVGLYRRGPAGVGPTPLGLEFSRRIALAWLEIEQGLAEAGEGASGQLAIGTLPLLPRPPLAAAIAASGGLALRVVEGGYDDLVTALRSGGLDVILGALRDPAAFTDLVQVPLMPDPFVVAVAASHPLAGGDDPARLAACPWVVPAPELPRRRAVEALFANLPARPPVLLETNSLEMTLAVLLAGDAAALLPARLVAAEPALVALRCAFTEQRARVVGLTRRADWLPTAAQALFLAGVTQAYAVAPGAATD